VFDRDGKFLFEFGSRGQFNYPSGVTVDQRNNQIVVTDLCNHRIQIFDEKGAFLRVFGSKGNRDGQFDQPIGVVVDQQGNYVVADTENHRIQIFNSEGQFVRKFGSKGSGNGQMNRPLVLAFSRMETLWYLRIGAIGCKSLIFRGTLFGLWVLSKSSVLGISLLTLMTTSWWLITGTNAFKCSTRMATTSSRLEQGNFQALLTFAWIVREGLMLAGKFCQRLDLLEPATASSSFLQFMNLSLTKKRKKRKRTECVRFRCPLCVCSRNKTSAAFSRLQGWWRGFPRLGFA